jgi:hypothetical protein
LKNIDFIRIFIYSKPENKITHPLCQTGMCSKVGWKDKIWKSVILFCHTLNIVMLTREKITLDYQARKMNENETLNRNIGWASHVLVNYSFLSDIYCRLKSLSYHWPIYLSIWSEDPTLKLISFQNIQVGSTFLASALPFWRRDANNVESQI